MDALNSWQNEHHQQCRTEKYRCCSHPTCTLQVNYWIPFRSPMVWQRPTSGHATINPVMLRVREVKHKQHVMTSTFLDWVAFQLSSHQSSPLTHRAETPGNLLFEGGGRSNTTHSWHVKHHPFLKFISESESWYKFTNCQLLKVCWPCW